MPRFPLSPMLQAMLILFQLVPADSVLTCLGDAGKAGQWSSTPRKQCELKYPSRGTSRVSTKTTIINDLATWSNRGGTCKNVAIDTTPQQSGADANGGEFAHYSYCGSGGCPAEGCGLYCFADVTTCTDTEIPNSIAHEATGSVKSIVNNLLTGSVSFECKHGFYQVGAIGGKMLCGDNGFSTTWSASKCVTDANMEASERNPNVFLFTNYDGGVLNIVVNNNTPNIKIGIVSYEAVTVNIQGTHAASVVKVVASVYPGSYAQSSITCTDCTSAWDGTFAYRSTAYTDPVGNAKMSCMYSGTMASQGGCASKGQTVAAFDTIFGENVDRVQCQYGSWNGKTYTISSSSVSDQTPMSCPGSNCAPRGCTTDTPIPGIGIPPTCADFSCSGTSKGCKKSNPSTINKYTVDECCEKCPCLNTDATVMNINAAFSCVCGSNTCTTSNGLYCTSLGNQCSWKHDPCTNTFGSIVNDNACTCVSLYSLVLVLCCFIFRCFLITDTFFQISIYLVLS